MAVSCGFAHSSAVTEDGRLYVWGSGWDGALGLGDHEHQRLPQNIETQRLGGARVLMAVCGDSHTMALTECGALWAWGNGGNGRLGDRSTSEILRPLVVGFGGERLAQVAAGVHHSAAVTDRGHLYMWGSNDGCRLGVGDEEVEELLAPTKIAPAIFGSRVTMVACGGRHTCAVTG
jgi:alpha-tubulin suppressor-like RCC1 family protein